MTEELITTEVRSTSTGVRGRCITSARTNHWVIDEPAAYGGPGEEVTPGEVFLGGIVGCGVLLVESFAAKDGAPIRSVKGTIKGIRKKADPSWFIEIQIGFEIAGAEAKAAEALVERFKAS